MGERHGVRQRGGIDERGARGGRQPRAERGGGVAGQHERGVRRHQRGRRVERGRLQHAPVRGGGIPCIVGPVGFVHARVECGEHARGRLAARLERVEPRMLGAGEQRADRHDRQVAAEREPLRDAGGGAQSGERTGAGAERDRGAIGERAAGLVEQLAHGGQHARAGDGARLVVAEPDARRGGGSVRPGGRGNQGDRAEFGRGIDGEEHVLRHGRHCNAAPRHAGSFRRPAWRSRRRRGLEERFEPRGGRACYHLPT
ncbi:hypothetical protein B7760_01593 [Burkholderia glumae]|nr:hypothetical protein B7760_01593 [Burkholderia glumae]QKM54983.1 hypothetical protein CG017_03025 [Burkholderia glumae]